ncbi:hypothetical protein K439DRAFT_65100 [Ramaria rubella]|nr:hypothetical protein K439DRAFT_65100 [Ramaria rubella]
MDQVVQRSENVTSSQKAWKYVDPNTPVPTDKDEKMKWNEIHDQLVGAMGTIVDPSLQHELESITEAPKAWLKLKEKTHSHGIIAKLESISMAIRMRFSSDVPFSKTITEIRDAVAAVFEGTAPTEDEWSIILLLNALSDGQYDWLRKDLLTFMVNQKVQLSITGIIECLDTESRESRSSVKKEESVLLLKNAKRKGNQKGKPKCTNCNKTGHSAEKCWKGKESANAPEWWKKKNGDKANTAETDSGSESAALAFDARELSFDN